MSIIIEKLSESEFRKKGIYKWPVWEKEVSVFDWTYDEKEQFYLVEGEIDIKAEGQQFHIIPGDFVTCPKGLDCNWDIKQYVKKHYKFIED